MYIYICGMIWRDRKLWRMLGCYNWTYFGRVLDNYNPMVTSNGHWCNVSGSNMCSDAHIVNLMFWICICVYPGSTVCGYLVNIHILQVQYPKYTRACVEYSRPSTVKVQSQNSCIFGWSMAKKDMSNKRNHACPLETRKTDLKVETRATIAPSFL